MSDRNRMQNEPGTLISQWAGNRKIRDNRFDPVELRLKSPAHVIREQDGKRCVDEIDWDGATWPVTNVRSPARRKLHALFHVGLIFMPCGSSGQAQMTDAGFQKNGAAPVIQIDERTGRPVCLWNCTLYARARIIDIKVMGADERTLSAATTFTGAERKRFSGVGRIECPAKLGGMFFGTGVHIRDFSTMVTTAHSFRDPDDGSKINPKRCSVAFYNADGSLREKVAIAAIMSRWDKPGYDGDLSNDLALVRLVAETQTPEVYSGVRFGEIMNKPSAVSMVGYHADLRPIDRKIVRRVTGSAISAPPDNLSVKLAIEAKIPLRNPENLISADFDSQHGTSGAPVYNVEGKMIGINQGATGIAGNVYDARNNYNVVIRFDESFRSELNAF